MSGQFKCFVDKHGIQHQTTCPYTPQQNGVAERKNRHILEVARTMLFGRGMPKRFWGDAVMTATYLINRLPSKGLKDKSPYMVLNKCKPRIDHLRVFGCVCFVFVPEANRSKLDAKSIKCVFIGYSTSQKGYKCYCPEQKRVFVSRDVKFREDIGYYNERKWGSDEDWFSSHDNTNYQFVLDGLQERRDDDDHQNSQENEEDHEDDLENTQEETSETDQTEGELQDLLPTHELEDASTGEAAEPEPQPPALRRSTRIKFGPDHWKSTRVYYNGMAALQTKGEGSTVEEKCSGCTVGFNSPIGNSVSPKPHGALQPIPAAVTYPIEEVYSCMHLPLDHQAFIVELDKERVPNTFGEAYSEPGWKKAIEEELESMDRNNTWSLVTLPEGKKTVGCKWVFTNKFNSSGALERHKARLVAKGYTQVYGEDYTDTFAPVAKLHSVRVLLSIAINNSWGLWQMDVKNAFLQGDLEEEVYMDTPEGLETSGLNVVCKLHKAIYGLKQSPRAWYHRLSTCLEEKGFKKSHADHSLFVHHTVEGSVIVLIYVDDIILTGSNHEGIIQTKEALKKDFDIKDLGNLKYFLGIEMNRSEEGMHISQRKYALELLSETGKLGARPARTPIEDNYKVDVEKKPWPEVKQFQRLVGKLIYLTITRPDICFAVNQVSKHMQNPTYHHWNMMERILRYIKASPGKGVWLRNNESNELVGFSDADWAGDQEDRKSTTGYCMFVGGNMVTWKSKKQKVVSLSSAEAEYRAMKDATKEIVWLRGLMQELGLGCVQPTTLFCDNQAALHIASNPVFHERTKHVEVDCHFVREKIQEGIITPSFVKSQDQLADIFTKATTTQICIYIHNKIGLKDPHQPILRGSVGMCKTEGGTQLEEGSGHKQTLSSRGDKICST